MKKKYLLIISASIICIALSVVLLLGNFSNKQLFDFNQKFEYAYVCWPDGTAEKLNIKSWKDYEGEQIQITTDKGTYLFHSENIVLAHE